MATRTRYPQENKRPSTQAPDRPFVSIYCNHDGERVPMRTFIPFRVVGDNIEWQELEGYYQSVSSDTLIPISGHATQFLDENDAFIPYESATRDSTAVARSKAKLVCRRHSAPVITTRFSNLNPILTTLAQFEIKEIEFELFRRRVETR